MIPTIPHQTWTLFIQQVEGTLLAKLKPWKCHLSENCNPSLEIESDLVRIEICLDHRGELQCSCSLTAADSKRLDLGDVIDVGDVRHGIANGTYCWRDSADLAGAVSDIANVLVESCRTFLSGDSIAFNRFAQLADARAKEVVRGIVDEQIRAAAAEAFRRHEWAEVVKLYGQLESPRSPVEQARLEYAIARAD